MGELVSHQLPCEQKIKGESARRVLTDIIIYFK